VFFVPLWFNFYRRDRETQSFSPCAILCSLCLCGLTFTTETEIRKVFIVVFLLCSLCLCGLYFTAETERRKVFLCLCG
jgi:RsiW-degrading membrane proteinase PrsW (M82 family)